MFTRLTTGWRAPEVFHVQDTESTQEYKWHAEVYEFAMICYEIPTGKLPFEECTNLSIHEHFMAGTRAEGRKMLGLESRCEHPTFEEIVKSMW